MKKHVFGWMAGTMVVMLGFAVVAASEKPPEDYVKAMKAINTANGTLRGQVTAKDYAGIEATAATLKASFETSLKFWEARKTEDATGWSKGAIKAADDLAAAAKAKNDEGITTAQRAIGGSCQTCHTAHRERLPDGTSEIK